MSGSEASPKPASFTRRESLRPDGGTGLAGGSPVAPNTDRTSPGRAHNSRDAPKRRRVITAAGCPGVAGTHGQSPAEDTEKAEAFICNLRFAGGVASFRSPADRLSPQVPPTRCQPAIPRKKRHEPQRAELASNPAKKRLTIDLPQRGGAATTEAGEDKQHGALFSLSPRRGEGRGEGTNKASRDEIRVKFAAARPPPLIDPPTEGAVKPDWPCIQVLVGCA